MASLDMSSMDPVLKSLYRYERIIELAFTDNPLYAMLPKFEDFQGKNMPIPLRYGRPMGRSATFSTAQSNAAASLFETFDITLQHDYGVVTIDGMTIRASRDDPGAFIEARASEIDGILMELARNLNRRLYRSECGALARVLSLAGEVITLANTEDSFMFEVGMTLVISQSANGEGYTIDNALGEAITAIDYAAGTLTFTDASDLCSETPGTDPAVGDYLYCSGDALNAATIYSGKRSYGAAVGAGCITGLSDWLCESAPTTGYNFFGVNRCVSSRLWGNYYDGSALTYSKALLDGCGIAAVHNGKTTLALVNTTDFRAIVEELNPKVTYESVQALAGTGPIANIGFEGIVVQGTKAKMHIIPDADCPRGYGWCLDPSSWELVSMGQCPQILSEDGLRMLRQSSADGYEVRAGWYAQLTCNAPGKNCKVKLP